MKKIICLILAIFFYIIGIIGCLLPIVPQIPFFAIGTLFLVLGFENIKKKILESNLYKKHLKEYVENNKFLLSIFSDK